ncbi:MAG: sulfoxide reductase heme-binding subunit YedZ [Acidobacteriia bacterium]|nr:sulfoxide reductase heme-binding subunit YedZ [Terriglobia bacterium]
MNRVLSSRWTKVAVFLLCLTPILLLGWRLLGLARQGWQGYDPKLTADPIAYITHYTGDWTIRFLLIALGVTPLRKLLDLPKLARYRRMLGLFAFFYGFLHLMTWVWLDKFFDPHEMVKDVIKRRFITAGMTAFALLIPLAVTSTSGWVRRLGFLRWQRLHRLVYFSALAAVIHYYWLVKSDVRLPLMYGGILAVLMLYRAAAWLRSAPRRERAKATSPNTVSLRD